MKYLKRVKLRCNLCGKIFDDKPSFKTHLRKNAANSCPGLIGMKTCPVCKEPFRSEADLRRHLRMSEDPRHENTCLKKLDKMSCTTKGVHHLLHVFTKYYGFRFEITIVSSLNSLKSDIKL